MNYVYSSSHKNKPLMVLLHGGGVAGWKWNAQVEYFKKDWQILMPVPGTDKAPVERTFLLKTALKKFWTQYKRKKKGCFDRYFAGRAGNGRDHEPFNGCC